MAVPTRAEAYQLQERGNVVARGTLVIVSETNICRIPFFRTLFSGRFPDSKQDSAGRYILVLDPVVLNAVLQYVETGRCQHLLTSLPTVAPNRRIALAGPSDVLSMLDFLCIELEKPSLEEVRSAIGEGIHPQNPWATAKEREMSSAAGRDAAVHLFLGLTDGTYGIPNWSRAKRQRDNLFNMLLVIATHPAIFCPSLGKWAQFVAKEHLPWLTPEQLQLLGDGHELRVCNMARKYFFRPRRGVH